MTDMSNSSVWIASGLQHGVDLSFLYEDKVKMYERVDELGLPSPARFYFHDGPDWAQIRNLFDKSPTYFCRLIPKNGGFRPYTVANSVGELERFCAGYDLSKFLMNLVEADGITHSGAIISGERCAIELVEGVGEDLTHMRKTPVSAVLDFTGCIKYETVSSEEERILIWRALRFIGGKHPVQGYFEFDVISRERISFRNCQPPDSVYAMYSP